MRLSAAILLPLLATLPLGAQTDYQFGLSNINSSVIRFTGTGNSFEFLPEEPGSFDFKIVNSDSGYLDDLLGRIQGTFFIEDTVDISGKNGRLQSAEVNGSGLFQIEDGEGGLFSATVDWTEIYTVSSTESSGGELTKGSVNLGALTFSYGTNQNVYSSRLDALAKSTSGYVSVTFQFVPAVTVTQLITDGSTYDTRSYSGTVDFESVGSNIPEPSTYAAALALAGLVSTAWMRRRRVA